MKKSRLKQSIREKIPLAFFFIVMIVMPMLIGIRNDDLNKKSATESEVQIAQINENL